MAIYINSLKISAFRGIKDLELEKLNHINIISGDNNSGKTSILEAISILKNPLSVYDLIRVSRIRETRPGLFSSSPFECFLNMLTQDNMDFRLSAKGVNGDIDLELTGKTKSIMIDKNTPQYMRSHYNLREKNVDEIETTMFLGIYKYALNSDYDNIPIEITPYTNFNDLPRHSINYLNISYLSPSRHLLGNNISNIVRSGSYKDLCVFLLQMFDPDIEDLLYIKNDLTNRPVEAIRHKKIGTMPLSTYGDGIKKVISLANGIASAKDGILMIDEIETSIHSKYYKDIFMFLLKACIQYNVQLFVTTHSKEAIDAILYAQNYAEEDIKEDPINVITFRTDNNSSKTLSRTMLGSKALENREKFDFEVRI